MLEPIASHHAELTRLCANFHVQRLEVFGSAAERRFDDASSDLDFLVQFLPLPEGERAEAYFGLLEALEALFGRPVDLVMTNAIRNPYFLEQIASSRTTVYAA